MPPPADRPAVSAERIVDFIDKGGCRDFSGQVRDFVSTEVLPDFPCLVAVDHSLTGGAFEAISQHYGPGEVSLVVIDSHTDAVPMSKLAEAIFYDVETNPNTVYDRADPLLYNRSESYSASSFLHHLVAGGIVDARDLYILGVSDYPGKKALRIKDPRIAGYVAAYTDLKKAGATIVTKQDCQLKPSKVKSLLRKIRTPYVYLSVDMDIGSRNALHGVRFRNWQGLSESQLLRLVSTVWNAGGTELTLVGMDLTEIDPRRAGQPLETGQDATYRIAAGLVRQFAFGLPPDSTGQPQSRDKSG
jgi:arginase family enzyme